MNKDIINRFRSKVGEQDLVLQMYRDCKGKNLWNIICSAMDWIDVVVETINTNNLSYRNNNDSSIKAMTFITCIDVLWEAVQQLHRVFFALILFRLIRKPKFFNINFSHLRTITISKL